MDYYDHLNNNARVTEYGDALIFLKSVMESMGQAGKEVARFWRLKEFRNMLCLQPAIIERALKLKPGQEWTGRVHFTVVNSSYFSGPLEPNRPSKPAIDSSSSS